MPYVTEETLTPIAIERWQQCHSPRMRELMGALIKHLHGFVREVNLTEQEWMYAMDWLARTGKICTDKRHEFILASDVLGISMLVDAVNHRFPAGATPSTVQGPFHIEHSPELAAGADMAAGVEGELCYVVGTIRGMDGKPIAGAMVDVWQADADGMYEAQLPNIEGARLRAVYRTAADGSYCIRTIVPLGYSIPMDGTVGELMKQTDISHFRPAHIHFLVEAPGHERLVTHLFRRGGEYLDNDVVFGVKQDLITEFRKMPAGRTPSGEQSAKPFYVVNYDFVLSRKAANKAAA